MTTSIANKSETSELNKEIRKRFNQYWKDNFQPNLKLIANYIDTGYTNFKSFNSNHKDYGQQTLKKIDSFLKEQGY